ncbi:hypothetical protein ACEPPI_40875, partial [Streptomyces sp. AB3(2024)]
VYAALDPERAQAVDWVPERDERKPEAERETYRVLEDTTTHRGTLVWKAGAGIRHLDEPPCGSETSPTRQPSISTAASNSTSSISSTPTSDKPDG